MRSSANNSKIESKKKKNGTVEQADSLYADSMNVNMSIIIDSTNMRIHGHPGFIVEGFLLP